MSGLHTAVVIQICPVRRAACRRGSGTHAVDVDAATDMATGREAKENGGRRGPKGRPETLKAVYGGAEVVSV